MKQLLRGEYLIQEVPKNAVKYEVQNWISGQSLIIVMPDTKECDPDYWQDLPEGQWQIVEPTEEVAREIVENEWNEENRMEWFKDYTEEQEFLYTALESYRSLLRSEGIEHHKLLKKI